MFGFVPNPSPTSTADVPPLSENPHRREEKNKEDFTSMSSWRTKRSLNRTKKSLADDAKKLFLPNERILYSAC